jgi:selenocysteine-specific elongation factor
MTAAAYPLILGTAGHIDHGKTSLVRALTGIDTDRLPVEKARGITTELGFAHLDLGDGRRIAVVDVPGHERFVKAMVAGASGIDLVCMVIAGDEGVMPQTREHLDICHLLGVRRGVIVLTKHDLVVDEEWRAMVRADITAAVAGSFLADAKIVEVSTRTGYGLDELVRQLTELADQCPPRSATGVFRQAVDRVFTIKGFGTVVTGTILGGTVRVGDELEILPEGRATRVRGIEVHGAAADTAHAGMRAALNLGGTALDEVARGDLLVHPGRVAASHILDVRVSHIASARHPLGRRTKVLVHHTATQLVGSLVLVDRDQLAPGASALAQLRLDASTPLGAMPGDRFILRAFAAVADYGTTLGGGEVIRVLAPKARRASDHAATVAALAESRRAERAVLLVRAAAAAGLTLTELARRLGAEPAELTPSAAAAVASGELMATGEGSSSHYLHAATVAILERQIADAVAASPEGALREDMRTHLPAALPVRAYDAILANLAANRRLVIDGERVKRVEAPTAAAPALSAAEVAVLERLRSAGVEPPRPKELPELLRLSEATARAALDRLIAAKLVTKIKPDLVMETSAVTALRQRLLAFLEQHREINPQQWKELVGASRKFTIPLAEFFDAEKLTLRVGDLRRRR